MYIFKEDERIVDIMSVNTMICEECTIRGASVFEDALPTQGQKMSVFKYFLIWKWMDAECEDF